MTQEERVELKPCPFCGGEAVLSEHRRDERYGYNTDYLIQCGTCGASAGGTTKKDKQGWADDPKLIGRQETIERWNTRAAIDAMFPQDEVGHAAGLALHMVEAALRDTSEEMRADSDDVGDAILGIAESLKSRRALMVADIKAALSPPSTAREEVIEEAAKVAEAGAKNVYGPTTRAAISTEIASAIRALKGKPPPVETEKR